MISNGRWWGSLTGKVACMLSAVNKASASLEANSTFIIGTKMRAFRNAG